MICGDNAWTCQGWLMLLCKQTMTSEASSSTCQISIETNLGCTSRIWLSQLFCKQNKLHKHAASIAKKASKPTWPVSLHGAQKPMWMYIKILTVTAALQAKQASRESSSTYQMSLPNSFGCTSKFWLSQLFCKQNMLHKHPASITKKASKITWPLCLNGHVV